MLKRDIRNQPAYTVAEAARYLKVAPATLRSWLRCGAAIGSTATPLIQPASKPPPMLSFWNLIEAHVLRALRVEHGVSMDALRKAIRYAEKSEGIPRLLLSSELRTDAGKLLLERYGKLIELSASGQIAMRHMFNEHLERVEWDEWKFPVRLFPFASSTSAISNDRSVAIDSQLAFGRPVIVSRSISTSAIVRRIDAGETPKELAEDYELTEAEVESAVLYEQAA